MKVVVWFIVRRARPRGSAFRCELWQNLPENWAAFAARVVGPKFLDPDPGFRLLT